MQKIYVKTYQNFKLRSALLKFRVLSAKRRWDTTKDLPSKLPTRKPDRRPSWTTLSNILPRAYMTKTNSKGDNGSPCLNPLELSKNPHGEPLIKIEKWTVDRQKKMKIHRLHLLGNPLRSNNFIRKPQFTWSKAF